MTITKKQIAESISNVETRVQARGKSQIVDFYTYQTNPEEYREYDYLYQFKSVFGQWLVLDKINEDLARDQFVDNLHNTFYGEIESKLHDIQGVVRALPDDHRELIDDMITDLLKIIDGDG